jgi:nucleotide-binding universal stress UspA family protein
MKTIIAGTDFSSSSVNACKYACFLAQKLKCKLVLFNMFEAPILHSNVGLYGYSYASVKKNSEDKIEKLIKNLLKLFPDLVIETFVTIGGFKEELENFISSHHIEAAVMGLETKNKISKFIYGSHGIKIAGKINTPVIIVPQSYKKFHLSKLLLAVDNNEKLNQTSLKRLETFITVSKSRLNILHVRTEDEIFKPKINSITINDKQKKIEIIEALDIQDGIKKYCRIKKPDLIVLISKKHSAFYNFFNESATKKIAFVSKVPIMAIHQ